MVENFFGYFCRNERKGKVCGIEGWEERIFVYNYFCDFLWKEFIVEGSFGL